MIFETERLIIRPLQTDDREAYYDMMSNPNVMNSIPREPMSRDMSDEHFEIHLKNGNSSDTKVWAIDSKNGDSFIGLAAYLKNDQNEDEIGYRLRELFWGIGYGTEIAKELIEYGFNSLNIDLITADVYVENIKSVKILDKFFTPIIEFYNPEDKCIDRRYKLTREEWL